MKDAFVMWREPRMVVLTAVCAAVYAAALLPFKFLVVFPGLAEVRPASALPVVFSLLFGPAGAWGAAFGNVVGDMLGGMFGPGSIFGFLANFAYGYLPYKLWEAWSGGRGLSELTGWRERLPGWMLRPGPAGGAVAGVFGLSAAVMVAGEFAGWWELSRLVALGGGEGRGSAVVSVLVFSTVLALGAASVVLLVYSPLRLVAVIFIASAACGGVAGWGVDLLGFVPFKVFATWIFANNMVLGIILVPPLMALLYPRVESRGMLYVDLLPERRSRPGLSMAGRVICLLSLAALFAAGVLIGPSELVLLAGTDSSVVKGVLLSPFVALFYLGMLLI